MKRTALLFLFSFIAAAAFADYSILWSRIASGGGTSTNGSYSLRGTIGQPDAGVAMTDGQYSLTGGFWTVTLVSTPDAPTLHLTNALPGSVTIWWTPPTTGYILQFTDSFSPDAWTNAPSGTNNPVTLPTEGLARFYRLAKL